MKGGRGGGRGLNDRRLVGRWSRSSRGRLRRKRWKEKKGESGRRRTRKGKAGAPLIA